MALMAPPRKPAATRSTTLCRSIMGPGGWVTASSSSLPDLTLGAGRLSQLHGDGINQAADFGTDPGVAEVVEDGKKLTHLLVPGLALRHRRQRGQAAVDRSPRKTSRSRPRTPLPAGTGDRRSPRLLPNCSRAIVPRRKPQTTSSSSGARPRARRWAAGASEYSQRSYRPSATRLGINRSARPSLEFVEITAEHTHPLVVAAVTVRVAR